MSYLWGQYPNGGTVSQPSVVQVVNAGGCSEQIWLRCDLAECRAEYESWGDGHKLFVRRCNGLSRRSSCTYARGGGSPHRTTIEGGWEDGWMHAAWLHLFLLKGHSRR